MPCTSMEGYEQPRQTREEQRRLLQQGLAEAITAGIVEALKPKRRVRRSEVDKVTDLLCTLLRSNPDLANTTPAMKRWWAKHKAFDKTQGR